MVGRGLSADVLPGLVWSSALESGFRIVVGEATTVAQFCPIGCGQYEPFGEPSEKMIRKEAANIFTTSKTTYFWPARTN